MDKILSKAGKFEEKEGDQVSCHAKKKEQNFMNFQKKSVTNFRILGRLISDCLQNRRRAFNSYKNKIFIFFN